MGKQFSRVEIGEKPVLVFWRAIRDFELQWAPRQIKDWAKRKFSPEQ